MPVVATTRRVFSNDDPLDAVLRPPQNEPPQDRQQRLAREEDAKRVSQAIDASIKAERQARRKKRVVVLLLLGQSESGEARSSPTVHLSITRCMQANRPLLGVSSSP